MEKKIICGTDYADTLERVIGVMRARRVQLGVRHILFVPDKYTLYAERLLYADTPGAFDAEVLTLNRLFFRLCEGGAYLSKQGAVMLTRKIIAESEGELRCFSRSAKFSGFAEKLYETMAQLAACRIRPEDLFVPEGALGRKIEDIRLIYGRYLARTAGKYVDSGGRMELLLEALDTTGYFDDTVVYFANYDGFTRQTADVAEKICGKARAAYMGRPDFSARPLGRAELYDATDPVDELKAAARRIRDAAYSGVPYGEICVATSDASFERIRRIFTEYEIPFYVDKKRVLGAHPLSGYLRSLLAVSLRPERGEVLTLVKNPYSGFTPAESDAFENYCNKFLIDYAGFAEPFVKGLPLSAETEENRRESARIALAESVRARVADRLNRVRERYRAAVTAPAFSGLIADELTACDAAGKSDEIGALSGEDWGDIAGRLLAAAGVLEQAFGGAYAGREELTDAYFEGLDATEVSLLPNLSGTVTVGSVAALRGVRCKRLFVLGANEGAIPAVQADGGILSDREIERLRAGGVDVQPKISEVNERARLEAESLLCAAPVLFVGYVSGGESRPSSFLFHALVSARVEKNSAALTSRRLAEGDDRERIARHVSSRAGAREALTVSLSGSGPKPEFLSELYAALGGAEADALPGPEAEHPDLRFDPAFFFGGGSTAISRIQEYFACPYRHFLKYGLRLTEREDGRLSPLDIGNFLHRVIELFVAKGEYGDVHKTVPPLVRQTAESDVKYLLKANDAVIRQISAEAEQIAAVVAQQITGGAFVPLGQEMRFCASGGALKTLSFDAGRKVSLTGVIDRADRFGDYARVVDYKTGQVSFSFTDLYYGRKIQLMLYMRVMIENGYLPAGMFYFPFSTGWSDDAFSHRLLGVYNSDPALTVAMDASLVSPGVKSRIIEAQTNLRPDAEGNPVLKKDGRNRRSFSTEELTLLSDYAFDVLQNGAREIAEGVVAPSPLCSGGRTECDFCEARCACGFDARNGKLRQQLPADAGFVLSCARAARESGTERGGAL